MTDIINKKNAPYGIFIIFIGCLYLFCSPSTVQTGDTGELVTNSYYLRVSHPPGYPLWTMLYHLPVRYLNFLTPFHVASILTSCFSLITLILLSFRFKNLLSLGVIGVLASSQLFWRYSVLPDVFALHALFLTLVFLGLMNPKLMGKPWFLFILSLSVAHHHTIIFAFPMFLYAFSFCNSKKNILYAILFGCLSMSFYLLLLYFNPTDLGSWGDLKNVKDVASHFLRKDYGTFKLHVNGANNHDWLTLVVNHLLKNFWSLIILAIYFIISKRDEVFKEKNKILIIVFCIIAYLLTFFFSGVMSLDGFGESIFERFLIHPFLIFVFLILLLINKSFKKIPRLIFLLVVINIGVNFFQNLNSNNFSNNTVVEDFIVNNFKILPRDSVLYTSGDTWGFSSYYVREVLGLRRDVHHFFNSLDFKWYSEKVKRSYPDMLQGSGNIFLDSFNFDKYLFFTNTQPIRIPNYTQLSFFGILYKLQRVSEISIEKKFECEVSKQFSWRHRPLLKSFEAFESSLYFDLIYGSCFFSRGVEKMMGRDYSEAIKNFEEAINLSPWSAITFERLCEAYKKSGNSKSLYCDKKLEQLLTTIHQQYYLIKF